MGAGPAIEALRKSAAENYFPYRSRKSQDDVEREVKEGQCNLRLNKDGEVLRTVSITLLRLTRDDNSVCVKVGEWDGKKQFPNSKVQLPGKKMKAGASPEDDITLLVRRDFPAMEGQMEIVDYEVDCQLETSQSFKLPTKYLRTTFNARLVSFASKMQKKEVEWKDDVLAIEVFQRGKTLYTWVSQDDFGKLAESDTRELFESIMSDWTGEARDAECPSFWC